MNKARNMALLVWYQAVLKQWKVSKDMTNFYTYNSFFKYIINTYIIALIMEIIDYKNIDIF